jgi:hypothetical protein
LPVPVIGSPAGGFDRVVSLANEDPAAAERRRRLQMSVLDSAAKDLQKISSGLAPASRVLLDEHLTVIREKETELTQPYVPITCDAPALPTGPELSATFRGHHASVVTAFRCGITRVAHLRVGGWGGTSGYGEVGVNASHHNVAHNDVAGADTVDYSLKIWRLHAEQFADLALQLDAIPEGDGTMLDSTVMVWFSELGIANFDHRRSDIPLVIVGGSRAGFKNGRFIDLGGVDYQHLLFTLARGMGLDDVQAFGDHGSQVLTQLLA